MLSGCLVGGDAFGAVHDEVDDGTHLGAVEVDLLGAAVRVPFAVEPTLAGERDEHCRQAAVKGLVVRFYRSRPRGLFVGF